VIFSVYSNTLHRHCERQRSNLVLCWSELDCFADARNDFVIYGLAGGGEAPVDAAAFMSSVLTLLVL
jgi:hypothetical protein